MMTNEEIRALISEQEDYVIHMRREFHKHPELSGKEIHTRELLIRELEEMGVPYKKLKGTGLIAEIKGAKPGKNRVLRADIDALPVQEDKEEGEKALKIITDIATATSACHQCGIEFEKRHCISPYPVINDEQVALKTQAQIASFCGEEVLGDYDRWYASECYSAYLNRYPGALGFLGIRNAELGSGAVHHNGKFDMDESALILGVYAETAFVFA